MASLIPPLSLANAAQSGPLLDASAQGTPNGVDVTAFGAKGDGRADDTAAIQEAIHSLTPASGGGTGGRLYLPPGTYSLSEPISLTYGVLLIGAGTGTTRLRLHDGANTSVITTGGTFPAYMGLAHLTIDGNRSGNPRGLDGIGLDRTTGRTASLDFTFLFDVRIVNCQRHGLAMQDNAETKVLKCVITGCGGNGIDAVKQSDSTITDVWMNGNEGDALYLQTCDQWTLSQLQLEGFANPVGCGIRMRDCSAVRITATSITGMSGAIAIQGGNRYINVSGCHFEHNGMGGDGANDTIAVDSGGRTTSSVVISSSTFASGGAGTARVRSHVQLPTPTGGGAVSGCLVHGNSFEPGSTSEAHVVVPDPVPESIADLVVAQNSGFPTSATGVACITHDSQRVDVQHGLGATPSIDAIHVTPSSPLGRAARYWVSNPTTTTFSINVDSVPGTEDATFSWQAALSWGPSSWLEAHTSAR